MALLATHSMFLQMYAKVEDFQSQLAGRGRYVRLNYMGFQMLTEKFDACLGTSGSPLFVSGLHCEPFCVLVSGGVPK